MVANAYKASVNHNGRNGMKKKVGRYPCPDRLRREAFGVRRIPVLCESSARHEAKAPEYGALQTLRAICSRLGRAEDPARRDALPVVSEPVTLGCYDLSASPCRFAATLEFGLFH